MEEVYQDLDQFEKRMKGTQNLENQYQSSSEEEDQAQPKKFTEMDVLKEKNRILMEKLFKADKQMNEYKEMVETISNGGKTDNKDKKIIELAKKNRALQLQVESLKTKAAKAAEFALKLKNEQDRGLDEDQRSPGKTTMKEQSTIGGNSTFMSGVDPEKRVKELEKKVTKMRNENQQLKGDLDKAIKLLERETGEVVNIDSLMREDSEWKGRAQKIESLKYQVKNLKQQLGQNTSVMGDGLSVISENTVFTGKITHAEKNLTKLDQNKSKDLEKLRKELEERNEELASFQTKYKAAIARRDTLEKQMKEVKVEFGSKIKILIDKTENDDKLIQMLKAEIKRLESSKGVKSQLTNPQQLQSKQQADINAELHSIKNENSRLKNNVKCLEIEVEQKNDKIKNLLSNCIGAPDEQLEEKELRIAELEDRVEQLEKEKFKMAQEKTQTKFGSGGPSIKSKDETDKIIADLSKQNAILRRKLDDAQQKLGQMDSTTGSAFPKK